MSNMELNKNNLKILQSFASDYSQEIYGRDIAKKLKMNQKTVANSLQILENKNILKSSIRGRNKYYSINKDHFHIKDIIKLIEITRRIEFLETNKKIKNLFDKLVAKTNGVLIVFGSYANRTNTSVSDLDILVIGKISDLNDLEELYKIKINVIKSSRKLWKKDDTFIKEVAKNHIILKGIGDFVDLIW